MLLVYTAHVTNPDGLLLQLTGVLLKVAQSSCIRGPLDVVCLQAVTAGHCSLDLCSLDLTTGPMHPESQTTNPMHIAKLIDIKSECTLLQVQHGCPPAPGRTEAHYQAARLSCSCQCIKGAILQRQLFAKSGCLISQPAILSLAPEG